MRFVGRFGQPLYREEDRGYTTHCWVWQAYTNPKGYGMLRRGGVSMLSHRWAYRGLVGEIPEGHDLDHLCRVRSCINPEHLEPVLPGENSRRGARAKLSATDVADIRARAAAMDGGDFQRASEIAEDYPVTVLTVLRIVSGKGWVEPKPRPRRAA